jgi:hypothetical protein
LELPCANASNVKKIKIKLVVWIKLDFFMKHSSMQM